MLVCAFVEKKPMADLRKAFRKNFQVIFTRPEVAVNNRHCRELFLSNYCQRNFVVVVVDEVYCIIEW